MTYRASPIWGCKVLNILKMRENWKHLAQGRAYKEIGISHHVARLCRKRQVLSFSADDGIVGWRLSLTRGSRKLWFVKIVLQLWDGLSRGWYHGGGWRLRINKDCARLEDKTHRVNLISLHQRFLTCRCEERRSHICFWWGQQFFSIV